MWVWLADHPSNETYSFCWFAFTMNALSRNNECLDLYRIHLSFRLFIFFAWVRVLWLYGIYAANTLQCTSMPLALFKCMTQKCCISQNISHPCAGAWLQEQSDECTQTKNNWRASNIATNDTVLALLLFGSWILS